MIPASPRLGINAVTGEGLAAALEGATVAVDVSNSSAFDYEDGPRLLRAVDRTTFWPRRRPRHVGHHVALSVVGTKPCPSVATH